ncbi:unnamed protein product, partial [Iphiclides podalirius]
MKVTPRRGILGPRLQPYVEVDRGNGDRQDGRKVSDVMSNRSEALQCTRDWYCHGQSLGTVMAGLVPLEIRIEFGHHGTMSELVLSWPDSEWSQGK